MQKFTPPLLIAILLICPYFCLGELAGGMVALHDLGSCSCTRYQAEHQSGSETPDTPNNGQPDCLCHGAGAVADGLKSAQTESMLSLTIRSGLLDVAPLTSACHSLAATSFELPHQFPPLSCGRDVCALTGVLLL